MLIKIFQNVLYLKIFENNIFYFLKLILKLAYQNNKKYKNNQF